MPILHAIVLGIVQGLSEFLPDLVVGPPHPRAVALRVERLRRATSVREGLRRRAPHRHAGRGVRLLPARPRRCTSATGGGGAHPRPASHARRVAWRGCCCCRRCRRPPSAPSSRSQIDEQLGRDPAHRRLAHRLRPAPGLGRHPARASATSTSMDRRDAVDRRCRPGAVAQPGHVPLRASPSPPARMRTFTRDVGGAHLVPDGHPGHRRRRRVQGGQAGRRTASPTGCRCRCSSASSRPASPGGWPSAACSSYVRTHSFIPFVIYRVVLGILLLGGGHQRPALRHEHGVAVAGRRVPTAGASALGHGDDGGPAVRPGSRRRRGWRRRSAPDHVDRRHPAAAADPSGAGHGDTARPVRQQAGGRRPRRPAPGGRPVTTSPGLRAAATAGAGGSGRAPSAPRGRSATGRSRTAVLAGPERLAGGDRPGGDERGLRVAPAVASLGGVGGGPLHDGGGAGGQGEGEAPVDDGARRQEQAKARGARRMGPSGRWTQEGEAPPAYDAASGARVREPERFPPRRDQAHRLRAEGALERRDGAHAAGPGPGARCARARRTRRPG